jgi:pyruvate-ferredoxin/flavodoxin oxidoreductase
MGASQSQFFKAMKEAEAFPGPSLIIAYSPCINHGLRRGMAKSQDQEKFAVDSGFWHMYRYNPVLEDQGKNPFVLDSKEPQWEKFPEFLNSEVRFTSLRKSFPKEADTLFEAAKENSKWRFDYYQRLAQMEFSGKE